MLKKIISLLFLFLILGYPSVGISKEQTRCELLRLNENQCNYLKKSETMDVLYQIRYLLIEMNLKDFQKDFEEGTNKIAQGNRDGFLDVISSMKKNDETSKALGFKPQFEEDIKKAFKEFKKWFEKDKKTFKENKK